jgi:hypothetical protein
MFRRALAVLIMTVVAMPFTASRAGANGNIVDAFHGAFAEMAWRTSSTSFGWGLVSREQDGTTHLSIHQVTSATVDGDGVVTDGTLIRGETTTGVTFTIDTVHYTSASVSGSIPVLRCMIVDGEETGCISAGTASLSATWVGVGPIPHFPDTELSWDDCLQVDRNSSVEREAVLDIELNINGEHVPAVQDGFAGFGKGNSRLVLACPTG